MFNFNITRLHKNLEILGYLEVFLGFWLMLTFMIMCTYLQGLDLKHYKEHGKKCNKLRKYSLQIYFANTHIYLIPKIYI